MDRYRRKERPLHNEWNEVMAVGTSQVNMEQSLLEAFFNQVVAKKYLSRHLAIAVNCLKLDKLQCFRLDFDLFSTDISWFLALLQT